MTDEVILTDEPVDNGDETLAPLKEAEHKIAALDDIVRQQNVAINVMRQRIIELELELLNTRCELASRDSP